MRNKKLSGFAVALAMFGISTLMTATRAAAQTETILHDFIENNVDGFWPSEPLIFDGSGNIYGTTFTGGPYGTMAGTVFELKPAVGGGWNEEILHAFNPGAGDGNDVYGGLVFDGSGKLYGTTSYGGAYGSGTVYQLVRHGAGWTERILHSFGSGTDGKTPYCTPLLDASGNLYCTTMLGGTNHEGTVFELKHGASGWTEKILFNFIVPRGAKPGFLMFDGAGNLWGTAGGGSSNYGVVFELVYGAGGGWTEKVIHDFQNDGIDGKNPGPLVFDTVGNLYGTTFYGGVNGYGTLFELSPSSGGTWTESILHAFTAGTGDCYWPDGNLLIDSSGSLYSTCEYGGDFGYGTIFKFSPATGGGWSESILYSFGNGIDGQLPTGGITFDASGNIYGTTLSGGPNTCEGILGCGTVYEFTP